MYDIQRSVKSELEKKSGVQENKWSKNKKKGTISVWNKKKKKNAHGNSKMHTVRSRTMAVTAI